MAGKACVLTSHRLFYAMDKLSKNTLIDLVTDRARAELGEDAGDEAVADLVQQWINPVAAVRNDRPTFLRAAMGHLDKLNDKYRRLSEPHECAHPGCTEIIKGGELCREHSLPANRLRLVGD